MITERMNNRQIVYLWLAEMSKTAHSEKAEFTQNKIEEMAEPIFSNLASSNAADPARMKDLLESGRYPKKAVEYLTKNWFINIGIPDIPGTEASKAAFDGRCQQAAVRALRILTAEMGPVSEITGKAISDSIEEISKRHFVTKEGFAKDFGHGAPILLREMLGLPGDADVCEMMTDKAVLENAAHALEALGVTVEPDAYMEIHDWVEGPSV